MQKKLLTIVLAAIMVFGVLAVTAAPANAAQLGLEKHDYTGGETIFVIANGITRQMVKDKAFVALYSEGAAHDGWRKYNTYKYPQAGDNYLHFSVPTQPGNYEFRLYRKDGEYTSQTFVTAVRFTVLPAKAYASIISNKKIYTTEDTIIIDVAGITKQMVQDKAFVALFDANASHMGWRKYNSYQYPRAGSSILHFKAPKTGGNYEMRLYRRDGNYTNESYVATAAFTVEDRKFGNLHLAKRLYRPGETINISTTGITETMVRNKAFVAIFDHGANHEGWRKHTYRYPKLGKDTLQFSAPSRPGSYEFRLYRQDGKYTDDSYVTTVAFTVR